MAKESSILGFCISVIFFGMGIALLVYTIRIYDYSKEDPFKKTTKKEIADYFKEIEETYVEKKCKCGEIIVNDFCSEEQKLSGCIDIISNLIKDKKHFLRHLIKDEKCNEYKETFKRLPDNGKISEVFDLKLGSVHKMAKGILILVIINFAIIVLIILASCGQVCCGSCALVVLIPFLPIIILSGIFSGLVNFILFIILCVQYKKGKVDEYVDFLNCDFIYRNKFHEKFGDLEELKNSYTPFVVLNVIFIIIGCINNKTSAKKNDDENI